jgi:hypothetical protein
VYFVDGVNYPAKLDLTTKTVTSLTGAPLGCRVCATYRTRLVVANQDGFPQNIYMSRAGAVTDWDYGQTDAQAAVDLNASESAGRVGEPVYALIPFRDDALIVGCDHSTYLIDGDPADSGSVLCVSNAIGFFSKDSWTIDPAGNVWFVGQGGFYKMAAIPGSVPVNVSAGRERAFFNGLSRNADIVNLIWDRDRNGCWIYVANKTTGASRHMWYDVESDEIGAFFPQQFPDSNGPLSAALYDGDGSSDRYPLLGGVDGNIRTFNNVNVYDDDGGNVGITSFVEWGASRPGGAATEARLNDTQWVFGELPSGIDVGHWAASWKIKAGRSVQEAYASPRILAGGTFALPGRQLHRRQRVNGAGFVVRVENQDAGNTWTFEQVTLTFAMGGKNR